MSFSDLQLDAKLLRAIEAAGFSEPTAIQNQAIPLVLAGRDLQASAQTGTGKTAAFVLPALHKLQTPAERSGHGPRVLILTPTRELATQINDEIWRFNRFTRCFTGSVVGGMPYGPQFRLLRQPLDILVATPGRLMDHMAQRSVDFSRLEMLVLDEADRMLDMGFVDAVREIAAATPASRQTLLFSATLEGKVFHIAKALLRNPETVRLAANTTAHHAIAQHLHLADDLDHKQRLLDHFVQKEEVQQAVIFASTKRGADRLARVLADQGHATAALHGDMPQNARKRTVEQMRRGAVRLLVATDVAARGLDIKGVTHVINFDLPMTPEDYIHRIGRTGRGGATGTAVSFAGPEDWHKLSGIERLLGRKLDRTTVAGLEPTRVNGFRDRPAGRGRPRPGGGGARSGAPRRYAGSPSRTGQGGGHRHESDDRRNARRA
jgi:superfamily II DNA/RNA helicase